MNSRVGETRRSLTPALVAPVVGVLTLLMLAMPAEAQEPLACPTTADGRFDVEEILEFFELEFPRHETGRALGSSCLSELFLSWESHPNEVETAFDRLERMALRGEGKPSTGAVGKLGQAGDAREGWPGVPSVIDRLERIYTLSDDRQVRRAVATQMTKMPDTTRVVAFLRGLAIQGPDDEEFPGAAVRGVYRLSLMGDPGRAALQELHDQGLVRSPEALLQLRTLERRGFQPPG
jgi:hypothetical protein